MCTIRKRKVLSLKQKLEVCKRVDSGVSFRKIAEDFDVGMSIIPNICRSQRHLSNFNMDTSNSCSSRKSLQKASNNALDSEIYMWFLRKLALDQPISASSGWLRNSKSRHDIRETKIQDENLSADNERSKRPRPMISTQNLPVVYDYQPEAWDY
ncbi:Jerky protein [Trichinella spiralis]|uniref:Jerky protein n=1 Tax=Trichinella spiralis TaxID=6334 RepID=A0A0V1B4I0_TRISP|nr:Jerky protein [Trichinella spiralis]